jgi:hypothetical protein
MASSSGRKRRRHRWDSTRLRTILSIWLSLSTVAGIALAVWGNLARIDRLYQVGIGFLGSAILAGLLYGWIVLVEWIRNRMRERREVAGFALLMVLALLALLTGPVVHGLTLVQVRLKQAERQRDRLALRAVATDAFCNQVRALTAPAGATSQRTATPGGVEIRSEALAIAPSRLPLALRGITGDVWQVSSRAVVSQGEFGIEGYALRSGKGSARILIWLEQGLNEP